MQAWRAARYGTVRTQQLIQRAAARIARGCLARAFLAWKDKFNLVDKYLQMKRKALAVNRRGRMRRAFLAWRELTQERWWKDQMTMRDNDVDRLSRLVSPNLLATPRSCQDISVWAAIQHVPSPLPSIFVCLCAFVLSLPAPSRTLPCKSLPCLSLASVFPQTITSPLQLRWSEATPH